jgi:DNA-binding MarR family transcriptional regulator
MTSTQSQNPLSLDRQICFPLYAASRLVIRLYQPLLEPLGLTYPQYIVLLVLWQKSPLTVSEIGARTMLQSNTLTPLLKKLEAAGILRRTRDSIDERLVKVALTPQGHRLKTKCLSIPQELALHTGFPADKAASLKRLLEDLIQQLHQVASVGGPAVSERQRE